jgi:hypothetical protein
MGRLFRAHSRSVQGNSGVLVWRTPAGLEYVTRRSHYDVGYLSKVIRGLKHARELAEAYRSQSMPLRL